MRRRVMHSYGHDEGRRIRERALVPPSSLPHPDDDSVDTDSVTNEPDTWPSSPDTTDGDVCHILT